MSNTKEYLLVEIGSIKQSQKNNTSYYPLKFLDLQTKQYVWAYPTPRTPNYSRWNDIIQNKEYGLYEGVTMWSKETINANSPLECTRPCTKSEANYFVKHGQFGPKQPKNTVFNHPLFTVQP